MRPILLEFNGINSFSERQTVDFGSLLEYGIFGIFGDTGSGKSTILDAIGFALYGDVSRARTGTVTDVINYRSEKMFASFEFEIVYEGKRRIFRAEREVKRKNGVQTARVYERQNGALLALADGSRECKALIERILGLEQRDFEKCIALPQGEFAQFVKSARSDRLKLISRLFDLEAYGPDLIKKVNRILGSCQLRAAQAATRLEPYRDITEERLAAEEAELRRLQAEDVALSAQIAALRAEETRLFALYEKRQEALRVEAAYASLMAKREEMDALNAELSRLTPAAAALEAEGEISRLEDALRAAETEAQTAGRDLKDAEDSLAALAAWDEQGADAEIERLGELRIRAISCAQAAAKAEKRRRELEDAMQKFANERELFVEFDYDGRREALERRLAACGTGDFLAYAEAHGKDALFRGEYAQFAGELEELTEKHEEISDDSAPLIEKYKMLSAGEAVSFSALKRQFDENEREKQEIRDAQLMLEKQKALYDIHRQRLQALSEEIGKAKKELAEAQQAVDPMLSSPEFYEKRQEEAKRARQETIRKKRAFEEARGAAASKRAGAEARMGALGTALTEAKARLSQRLKEGGFSQAEEARSLAEKYGDPTAARSRLDAYRDKLAAVAARREELSGVAEDVTEAQAQAAREARAAAEERAKELAGTIARAEDKVKRGAEKLKEKELLLAESQAANAETERYEKLKKLLDNNKFMEFVAEEHLETVALNASGRLLSLTGGRYFLRYAGGFFVGDNFNGGALRSVNTLSGGETFLVSLSLALSLSAEICSRTLHPIEFFFLDEGFGTLDETLLDTVMDSLEKLRSERFSIGIISHVEELKHRIDRKLTVIKATERHGSQIQAE